MKKEIQRVFEAQQAHQYTIAQTTAAERKAKIKKLHHTIVKYRKEFQDAMYADFKKPPTETDVFDLYPAISEAKHTVSHLSSWMKPKKVGTPTALIGSSSYIKYEPKGVVLIISPWNVPINLTFGPLVAALAAGNCVILKPSELTPHTSAMMTKVIKELFDEKEVAIFEGEVEVSTELLKLPFNHIFFTGSPNVGKIVMRAAAENLASVTLELGGKCPTVIDETANLNEAASKITWAKYSNCGQTCLAPDYLLVHEKSKARMISLVKQQIEKLYGATTEDRKNSNAFTRIVNHRNYLRVKSLLEDALEKGAKIEFGGNFDDDENYIEPTILTGVTDEMNIMHEEIFGPLLPIISYKDNEAIQIINSKPKPLALYIYSKKSSKIDFILNNTRAGGSCVNDCTVHYSNLNLPFGGSNNSGIGKAHGFFGFEAFSNQRAVLKMHTPLSAIQTMHPPYDDTTKKMVDLTLKWF